MVLGSRIGAALLATGLVSRRAGLVSRTPFFVVAACSGSMASAAHQREPCTHGDGSLSRSGIRMHRRCGCIMTRERCAAQMLLQSVLRPGAGVAVGSLAVGVPALLAAFGSAVEGAAAANPGQAQVRPKLQLTLCLWMSAAYVFARALSANSCVRAARHCMHCRLCCRMVCQGISRA